MSLLEVARPHHRVPDRARREIAAVEDVSFDLDAGEVLGIVGESGSGKSVTALSIMGLLPQPPARIAAGSVRFAGEDLTTACANAACENIRGAGIVDDLPGADDLAQPGVHHRRPDHGDGARARAACPPRAPRDAPSRCSTRSASRRPPGGWTTIRTSSPAACASA